MCDSLYETDFIICLTPGEIVVIELLFGFVRTIVSYWLTALKLLLLRAVYSLLPDISDTIPHGSELFQLPSGIPTDVRDSWFRLPAAF